MSQHLRSSVSLRVEGCDLTLYGRDVVDFSSVKHLGLHQHQAVINASIDALIECERLGKTAEAYTKEKRGLLEKALADLVGLQASRIFISFDQVHLSVIPLLFGNADTHLIIDEFAHTSIHQALLAAKAKGAKAERMSCSDLIELERRLSQSKSKKKVLVIDGLYSLHGYLPNIRQIQEVCLKTKTTLYMDDSYGIGVHGENGGGSCEQFKLNPENTVIVASLEKSMGSKGAFIAASKAVIDAVASPVESITPSGLAGMLMAIRVCRSEEGKNLRKRLATRATDVRSQLVKLGFNVEKGDFPLITIFSGENIKTLIARRFLAEEGFLLNTVLYPEVPKNDGALRLSLTTLHADKDFENLMTAFGNLKKYLDSWTAFSFDSLH